MKPTNPLHIQSQPPQGKKLPEDWKATTAEHGGTFDRRPLEEMWKSPKWQSKLSSDTANNLQQSARLSAWDEILGQK